MQPGSEPAIVNVAGIVELNPYAAPRPIDETAAIARGPAPSDGGELSPAVLDELQRVANYRQMHKRLRASGIGSIFFGVLGIVVGANMLKFNSLNAILIAIGVLLLVEGLWLVIRPAPIGVILDGIALMLVGIWNIAVQILNAMAGFTHPSFWAVIGVCQIIWGIQALNRYSRFSRMPRAKPAPELLKRIDKIAKEIGKSKMAKDPELIELQSANFFGKKIWKGRLRASFAAFVATGHNEVIFARPADVSFTNQRKAMLGKSVSGTLRIADQTVKAIFSPEALKRYENWAQATTAQTLLPL